MARYSTTTRARSTRPVVRRTPQTVRSRADEVENSAGGFVFSTGAWKHFERFLILGTEGGTFYAGQQKLTREAAKSVLACGRKDARAAVQMIVDVSVNGRAAKQGPAVFALALLAAEKDPVLRTEAFGALGQVCRTPTHLFEFVSYHDDLVGSNTRFRKAVAAWYNGTPADKLAYHMVKYQNREGWTHRDLLRVAHVRPADSDHQRLFRWAVKGFDGRAVYPASIEGFERAKKATKPSEIVALIKAYNLTWEMVPSQFLKDASVWKALLPNMPLNALLRNLGRLSSLDVLKGNSKEVDLVSAKLTDKDAVKKARVHPLKVLEAKKVYEGGLGLRGSLVWSATPQVVEALEDTLDLAFGAVEPSGAKYFYGVDVSGSMGSYVSGSQVISCREAAAVMALVQIRAERAAAPVFAFDNGRGHGHWLPPGRRSRGRYSYYGDTGLKALNITKRTSLSSVIRLMSDWAGGGTDCALPYIYAREQKILVDVFVTITDNETWAGSEKPYEALAKYRSAMNQKAKSVVVAMTSTGFSINDPKDPLGLDVVGFDTATPGAISAFARL